MLDSFANVKSIDNVCLWWILNIVILLVDLKKGMISLSVFRVICKHILGSGTGALFSMIKRLKRDLWNPKSNWLGVFKKSLGFHLLAFSVKHLEIRSYKAL